MKKIIVSVCLLLFIGAAIAFAATNAQPKKFSEKMKPSEYGIGIKYEDAINVDKPFVALFYTDWCTYCMRFMPKYKIISKLYKKDYNFVMINAENENYEKLCRDIALGGFPTVYIIDPKIDNRIMLNQGIYMDLKLLRKELDRYIRIRKMINTSK